MSNKQFATKRGENTSVVSPFTPVIPDNRTVEFATGLLRSFGDFVLADTKGERIATEKENPHIFALFKRVLNDVANGKAVSIVPFDAELTTHQAANFLNISRPSLIKLLEEEKIPYHKLGTHRRVLFKDLAIYKEQQKQITRSSLKKLTELSKEYGLYK